MGEIKTVSPDKTHGYPYPVCKKTYLKVYGYIFIAWIKVYATARPPEKYYHVSHSASCKQDDIENQN